MKTVGSRAEVWHGTAKKTSGGLLKKDLKKNKRGRIVSKKMSNRAKKEKRLEKAGFKTKKGKFTLFKAKKKGGMNGNNKSSNEENEINMNYLRNMHLYPTKNYILPRSHRSRSIPMVNRGELETKTTGTNFESKSAPGNNQLTIIANTLNTTEGNVINYLAKNPDKLNNLTNKQIKFVHETAKCNYNNVYSKTPFRTPLHFREKVAKMINRSAFCKKIGIKARGKNLKRGQVGNSKRAINAELKKRKKEKEKRNTLNRFGTTNPMEIARILEHSGRI